MAHWTEPGGDVAAEMRARAVPMPPPLWLFPGAPAHLRLRLMGYGALTLFQFAEEWDKVTEVIHRESLRHTTTHGFETWFGASQLDLTAFCHVWFDAPAPEGFVTLGHTNRGLAGVERLGAALRRAVAWGIDYPEFPSFTGAWWCVGTSADDDWYGRNPDHFFLGMEDTVLDRQWWHEQYGV